MGRPIFKLCAGLVTLGAVLVSTTTVATADNNNIIELTATCDNGATITVEISDGNGSFPSGLRVVDSPSVFTVHQITITSHATGETFTVRNADGVDRNKDLVDCSRSGVNYDFVWTGFFTPASA